MVDDLEKPNPTQMSMRAQQILQAYQAYRQGATQAPSQPRPSGPPSYTTSNPPSTGEPIQISSATLARVNALRAEQDLPPLQEVSNVQVVRGTLPSVPTQQSVPQPERITTPPQGSVVLSQQQLAKTNALRASQGLQPIENVAPTYISSGTRSFSSNESLRQSILQNFEKNPEALRYVGSGKGSYLYGLFQKGVLLQSDFDRINQIVNTYNAQLKSGTVKGPSQTSVTSTLTTYTPANIPTALIGGALGGFGELGLMGIAAVSRLTGQKITIPGSGTTITPTGGILAQAESKVQKTFGQETLDQLITGQKVDLSSPLAIASLVGFGASVIGTGGTGLLGKAVSRVQEGITVSKFISKYIPTVTETVTAKEAVERTGSVISLLEKKATEVQTQLESLVKTPTSEKILGVSATRESLQSQASALSAYKEQLLTKASQLKQVKTSLENLAKQSPIAAVATTKETVVQGTERLASGVYALYFKASSPFAGAILTFGKKGVGTLVPILKEVPTGTSAVKSAELMSGVRGVIRQGLSQYENLSGPERTEKITQNVIKYLKKQKSAYEVTYPKTTEEAVSANVSIGPESERVSSIAKSLVPSPTVTGIGKELTFAGIRTVSKEQPFALSRELLGVRKLSYIEAAKTGEIHFTEANLKNIVGDINKLQKPIEVKEFASGLGEKVGPRPKGFEYLASRFGGVAQAAAKPFKAATKFEPPAETKGGAGLTGKAKRFGEVTQREKDLSTIQQMMKEETAKPLSPEESKALVRELGRRTITETPKTTVSPYSAVSTTVRPYRKTRLVTEEEQIFTQPGKLGTPTTTILTTKLVTTPSRAIRLPPTTTEKEKLKPGVGIITIPITTPITSVTTTTSQITKQKQGLQNLPVPGGSSTKLTPDTTKKPPFGGLIGGQNLPGALGKVGKRGARKGYIGNVPITNIVGVYKRSEITYGSTAERLASRGTKQSTSKFGSLSTKKGKRKL